MKYYYDCEFREDGKIIDLISIGIVSEDNKSYYAIHKNFDVLKAWRNEWLRENVLRQIHSEYCRTSLRKIINGGIYLPEFTYFGVREIVKEIGKTKRELAKDITSFISQQESVELWGYYSSYDHVCLAQIFGTMMDLPDHIPMYTRDIKQLCDSLGNPKLPEQEKGEHNALEDAKWNKLAHEFLMTYDKK